MRVLQRAFAGFGLGLALVVAGSANAQQPFDGRWSVEVITERGNCDHAYRYPLAVENGRGRYDGNAGGIFIAS